MNNDNNILIQNSDGIIGVGNISMDHIEGLKKELQYLTSRQDVFKDDFDFQLEMVNGAINKHNNNIIAADEKLTGFLDSSSNRFKNIDNKFNNLNLNLNKAYDFVSICIAILSAFTGFLVFGFIYLLMNL
jgi:hypothetical protein